MLDQALSRIAAHIPEPFIAPVPDARTVTVFTLQDGIPYRFRLSNPEPGWWLLNPTSETTAVAVREATPPEFYAYLDALPRFLAIAVFRAHTKTWVAIPYNASDAAQRGWPDGSPRVMHLTRHAIGPFDVVYASTMGNTLIYNRPAFEDAGTSHRLLMLLADGRGGPGLTNLNWQNAWDIVKRREHEIREEERQQAEAEQRKTVGGELEYRLAFGGAELVNWLEEGEGYRVHWRHGEHGYSMLVRRDMHIASAGICLEGTDRQHTLSSIVSVMERARELRRFDLEW